MFSLKDNCKYVLGSKGGRPAVLFPFFYQSCNLLVSVGRTENLMGNREKANSPALGGQDSTHTGRGTKHRGRSPSLWKSLSHVWLFVTPWNSPWNSPGQNTGVGHLSHLQGIFPAQVSHVAGRFFTSWATTRGTELQAFGQCFWCWVCATTPAQSYLTPSPCPTL